MKHVPILFNTPMVNAILDGTKTQTRRILKPQPDDRGLRTTNVLFEDFHGREVKPKANIGDILWVRETLYQNGELGLEYVADSDAVDEEIIPLDFNVRYDNDGHYKFCKIPSIYMPKKLCRIFLEVTDVRVERLHDISEDDALMEGIEERWEDLTTMTCLTKNYVNGSFEYDMSARESFFSLWESINGKESLESNPWVFAYSFKKVDKPSDFNQPIW